MTYPPPPPAAPPAPSRAYRFWAHALTWVPVAFVVVGVVASIVLFVIADSSVDNAAAGYLAIVILVLLLFGSPALLVPFVAGIVMLVRARR
jgi:hypothetical protein